MQTNRFRVFRRYIAIVTVTGVVITSIYCTRLNPIHPLHQPPWAYPLTSSSVHLNETSDSFTKKLNESLVQKVYAQATRVWHESTVHRCHESDGVAKRLKQAIPHLWYAAQT